MQEIVMGPATLLVLLAIVAGGDGTSGMSAKMADNLSLHAESSVAAPEKGAIVERRGDG